MTIADLALFKPGTRCRVYPNSGAKRFGHTAGVEVRTIARRTGITIYFTNGTQADADRCEII